MSHELVSFYICVTCGLYGNIMFGRSIELATLSVGSTPEKEPRHTKDVNNGTSSSLV